MDDRKNSSLSTNIIRLLRSDVNDAAATAPSARPHHQNATTSGRRLDSASHSSAFVSLIMEQLPSPPVIRCLPLSGSVQTDRTVAANSCSESTNQSHCDSQAQLTQDKNTFAHEPKWSIPRCDITDACRLHGIGCCTCSTSCYVDLTLCEPDTQDEALDLSVSKPATKQQASNETVSSLTSSALSQTQSMQGLIATNADWSHASCDGLTRTAVHPPDTYKDRYRTDIVSWSVQEVAEFVASIPGCACYRQVL